MTDQRGIHRILRLTARLVARNADIARLVATPIDALRYNGMAPRTLPAVSGLKKARFDTAPETAPLTRAILDAADELHWQQSYTKAQVGALHLANYGWFNLVSPEGPFISPDIRISVGYWAQGLTYPEHRHLPEEIYYVLAGRARFLTDGRPPFEGGPGTLIHHPPDIAHGFELPDAALLAMAFWRGQNLLRPSRFGDAA